MIGWSVSINGGSEEYIGECVIPEIDASSVRFAVVRVNGLPCEVERRLLVELLLPVSNVW